MYSIIFVDGNELIIKDENGDITEEMLQIPISNWNFDGVTNEDEIKIKEYVDNLNYLELIKIQNKYLFSGRYICCEEEMVLNNFKYFISWSKIRKTK